MVNNFSLKKSIEDLKKKKKQLFYLIIIKKILFKISLTMLVTV